MAKLDLSNLKKTLQDAVDKKNADKAQEDQIRQQKNQEDRNTMLESMSKDFGSVFKPYLDKIQEHSKLSSEELSRIIAQSVKVSVPDVNTDKLSTAIEAAITNSMAAIRIPAANHPITIPPIRIPPISMPEQMDIKGWIGVMGYDKGLLQNPLPVQIRDAQGNPVDLRQQAIQMMAGGGGKMDFFTINGITNTVGVVQINPDGSPFYSGSSVSGGGSTNVALVNVDGLYYNSDNPLPVTFAATQPVTQVSGASWSVNVIGAVNTSVGLLNSDGQTIDPRDRNWALTETLNVLQLSGAVNSVNVVGPIAQGDVATALRVVIAGNSDASVSATQVGTWNITTLTSITNSVAASLVDSSGVQYSGSNPLPVVFGASATQGVNVVDSSGVAYSGTNPVPTAVTGITNSVAVVALDRDGNPLTTGPLDNGDSATALRVVIAGNSAASVSATQVGTWNITTLTGITNSVAASIVDAGGVAYSGSNPLPVVFGASATQGVNVVDSSGVAYSGTNPVPTAVTGITNSVAVVALDRDGNPLTTGPLDNGDSATALRVVIAGNSAASVSATQVGTWNITTLTGITNSVAASLVDSSGVGYSGSNPLPVVFGASATQGVNIVDSSGIGYSGSNPVPTAVTGITNSVAVVTLDRDGNPLTGPSLNQGDAATALRVVIAGNSDASVSAIQSGTWNVATVTTITNSVAAMIVDSGGVGYSGSNPVPVALISGALTSTVTVGDSAARAADNGGNPVKVGGIARQTNPTAFTDGDRSNFTSDDLGRQVMRPVQVRDLTTTAFVSVTNGTETTLLAAGGAGVFLDLIFIKLTNNSSVAVGVDIRDFTAGGVIDHYEIPANGSVGGALPVPYPQGNANNNWTVDLPDITGTTVTVMGLFSKEV